MGPTRRLVFAWLPAALYMALIWWLSSEARAIELIEDVPFQDKGVHVLEYGALGVFLAHALRGTAPAAKRMHLWIWAFAGTVLWGMLDEIHQAFVPGRSSDIADIGADTLGAIVGVTFRLFVLSRWSIFDGGAGGVHVLEQEGER